MSAQKPTASPTATPKATATSTSGRAGASKRAGSARSTTRTASPGGTPSTRSTAPKPDPTGSGPAETGSGSTSGSRSAQGTRTGTRTATGTRSATGSRTSSSAKGTRTSSDRPFAPAPAASQAPEQEPASTRTAVRRSGTSRSATSRAARRKESEEPVASARPAGRSAVEALLADYPAERATDAPADRAPLDGKPVAAADHPRPQTMLTTRPVYPPVEDIALGVLSVIAERAWRAGSWGIAMITGMSMRAADVVRAVSPTFATEQADARLAALAERGRIVRAERTEALSTVVTNAISTAATSDAMRQMSVTAIEEATDDVLAVVLPAMLEAVTDLETQDKLDELMAGLLLRQLPSALEKTLPGVMMRTATKPAAGLMPFLSGVLPKG